MIEIPIATIYKCLSCSMQGQNNLWDPWCNEALSGMSGALLTNKIPGVSHN